MRADIRKSMENQTKSSADVASPGPLKNEKQWKHWEEKFVNYTRSHIRANGVPLSYIIHDNEEPYINGEHTEFINKTVAVLFYFKIILAPFFLPPDIRYLSH